MVVSRSIALLTSTKWVFNFSWVGEANLIIDWRFRIDRITVKHIASPTELWLWQRTLRSIQPDDDTNVNVYIMGRNWCVRGWLGKLWQWARSHNERNRPKRMKWRCRASSHVYIDLQLGMDDPALVFGKRAACTEWYRIIIDDYYYCDYVLKSSRLHTAAWQWPRWRCYSRCRRWWWRRRRRRRRRVLVGRSWYFLWANFTDCQPSFDAFYPSSCYIIAANVVTINARWSPAME